MEKTTQEIFKSGDKIFLTEKECLAYEKRLSDHKNRFEITKFLIENLFVQSLRNKEISLAKKDSNFTTYEFVFVSDVFFLNKYTVKNEMIAHGTSKPEESITLQLCDIDTFKSFYKILGI